MAEEVLGLGAGVLAGQAEEVGFVHAVGRVRMREPTNRF
jgi:hypothetical protein